MAKTARTSGGGAKAEGLQDTQNKRLINADDKLRPLFGGKKKVNMFEMTKLVAGHMQ